MKLLSAIALFVALNGSTTPFLYEEGNNTETSENVSQNEFSEDVSYSEEITSNDDNDANNSEEVSNDELKQILDDLLSGKISIEDVKDETISKLYNYLETEAKKIIDENIENEQIRTIIYGLIMAISLILSLALFFRKFKTSSINLNKSADAYGKTKELMSQSVEQVKQLDVKLKAQQEQLKLQQDLLNVLEKSSNLTNEKLVAVTSLLHLLTNDKEEM